MTLCDFCRANEAVTNHSFELLCSDCHDELVRRERERREEEAA